MGSSVRILGLSVYYESKAPSVRMSLSSRPISHPTHRRVSPHSYSDRILPLAMCTACFRSSFRSIRTVISLPFFVFSILLYRSKVNQVCLHSVMLSEEMCFILEERKESLSPKFWSFEFASLNCPSMSAAPYIRFICRFGHGSTVRKRSVIPNPSACQ